MSGWNAYAEVQGGNRARWSLARLLKGVPVTQRLLSFPPLSCCFGALAWGETPLCGDHWSRDPSEKCSGSIFHINSGCIWTSQLHCWTVFVQFHKGPHCHKGFRKCHLGQTASGYQTWYLNSNAWVGITSAGKYSLELFSFLHGNSPEMTPG